MKYPATIPSSRAQVPIEAPPAPGPGSGCWQLSFAIASFKLAWILFSIAIPLLANGTVPFDQPGRSPPLCRRSRLARYHSI